MVISLGWGWYYAENYHGFRFGNKRGRAQKDPLHILYPLTFTILGPLVAVYDFRRSSSLRRNGVKVTARVTRLGWRLKGMQDLSFSYEYDGKTYSVKRSVLQEITNGLAVGDPLEIVIDSADPTTYEFLS